MRKFRALLALLVLPLLVLAACGGDDGDSSTGDTLADDGGGDATDAGSDTTLTVYSGRSEDLIAPIIERFTAETGIEVEVRYDSSADLALLIDTEGDKTPADVFISQSPGAVSFLEGDDRLAPVDQSTLDLVDPAYRSGDGRWVGLSGRVRALVYNTDLVSEDELPDSVLDMADDVFAGRVAVAPTNGSFQDFVTAMRFEIGEDETSQWLSAMAENDSPTYANNSAIVEAVGRGEAPMGLVNHYYLYLAKADDPSLPIDNHYFAAGDIGSLLVVTGGAIIDGTDDVDAAQQFLAFLLSEEAQRFFAEDEFEYPLASGVEPSGEVPRIEDLPKTIIDLDELGGGLSRTAEIIADSGIDRS